jgi:hypothetical protein
MAEATLAALRVELLPDGLKDPYGNTINKSIFYVVFLDAAEKAQTRVQDLEETLEALKKLAGK